MPSKPTPASTPPAANKSRLGRGLNSLIKISVPTEPEPAPVSSMPPPSTPSSPVPSVAQAPLTASVGSSAEVPVEQIIPNPHQPRRVFSENAIRELADSIKANGIIQPLVVRRLSSAAGGASMPSFELIAGERRLRAAKLAGLKTVPCHIKEVDALTQAQMALVENIQRADLNPVERAEGYRTLLTQLGLTQSELAVRLGEERSTVANYVRLLELAEPVKKLLREDQLSLGHAKLIAGVPDILEQERLAKLVIAQGLSVRNLEKVIAQGAAAAPTTQASKGVAGRDAHFADLEKTLARQLGMRVQLRASRGKGKGKLTLHYASLDQFDQLMGKLGVEV